MDNDTRFLEPGNMRVIEILRPVLPAPWELHFSLVMMPNTEQEIINLLDNGGRALGFGPFRGPYGRFTVKADENEERRIG